MLVNSLVKRPTTFISRPHPLTNFRQRNPKADFCAYDAEAEMKDPAIRDLVSG
jgi:hypothetical protein